MTLPGFDFGREILDPFQRRPEQTLLPTIIDPLTLDYNRGSTKGVARIWFRGGGTHFGGGADPLFFASDPKSQGSPLCTFGYPWISGGRPPPPPPLATPLGSTYTHHTDGNLVHRVKNSLKTTEESCRIE